jgi:hypothetical protein
VKPWFANKGKNDGLWGIFMEKMWAKINGDYENIIGGAPTEGFTLLTGAQTLYYRTSEYSSNH